jgi:phosphoserine aminotransferase
LLAWSEPSITENLRSLVSVNAAAKRLHNFAAGPATLPLPVLQRVQQDLLALPNCGASILEISHRSPQFVAILADTERRLRELLSIPADYHVLFLQGGSRLQFSMVPMNLLSSGTTAGYVLTGSWGKKALEESAKEGSTKAVWDGAATNFDRLPADGDWPNDDSLAYVHFTSNETIHGVQFPDDPVCEAPLVCDASSDFLSRPIQVDRYGLIYACAQKNAGPAGVTAVIIRSELLERSRPTLPGYLNFQAHANEKSMYNTPPTFGIYVMGLVARWLQEEVGGLARMHERNLAKAKCVYDVIDASGDFYQGHAQTSCRSLMNVTFRLPSDELQAEFLNEAVRRNLDGLKGHRSVGGIRASIYNAMTRDGVDALCDLMVEFHHRN